MRAFGSFILGLAILPNTALAQGWALDASHSEIGFSVRHLVVSKTRGSFQKFSGKLMLDEKDITKSSVEVEVDVTSIFTNDAKRDEHLRSPDFFEVAKFPKMTFKSTKVVAAGKDKLKVTGDLTLHGVTKPVTLDVEGPSAPVNFYKKNRRGLSATGKINRQDFGVKWNDKLDGGGVVLSDEVNLEINAEFIQG